MKSEKLEIRLTVAEKERLYDMADGARLSDYVKGVLFGGVIPDRQVAVVAPEPVSDTPAKPEPAIVVKRDKGGRNYTGATVSKFGRVMREYVGDDGLFRMKYASVSKSEG